MISKLYDMHTHSIYSFDGSEHPKALCDAALKKGLAGIAITDHLDFGHYLTDDWQERLAASMREARAASDSFKGRLSVICGVEAGQPLQDSQKYEQVLRERDFDVVLMSLHNAAGREDYALLDYSGLDLGMLLDEYVRELLMMVRGCDFDVLAHIGYILRYLPASFGSEGYMRRWQEGADAILQELAGRGKALEINMAFVIRGKGEATAGLKHLRRFKELGGEYLTIASDAHIVEHIGGHFGDAVELAREAGFDHVAHYMKRKPVLTEI